MPGGHGGERCTEGERIFKNNNNHKHKSNDKSGNVMPRSYLQCENNFHRDAHRPCSLQRSKEAFWLVIMQLFCQWHTWRGLRERYALLVCLQPVVLSFIIKYLSLLVHNWGSTCSIIAINLHQSLIQLLRRSDDCSIIAFMTDTCETCCLCHDHA